MTRLRIIFLALLVSCSGPKAYVWSSVAPGETIAPNARIFVFVSDEAPIEDRKLGAQLQKEFELAGYPKGTILDSDYILTIKLNESTSTVTGIRMVPQNSTTSGSIGTQTYSASTRSSVAVPYTKNRTLRAIYVNAYLSSDVSQKKYITRWEGYIGALEEQFDENVNVLFRDLVQNFGRDFDAHVDVD